MRREASFLAILVIFLSLLGIQGCGGGQGDTSAKNENYLSGVVAGGRWVEDKLLFRGATQSYDGHMVTYSNYVIIVYTLEGGGIKDIAYDIFDKNTNRRLVSGQTLGLGFGPIIIRRGNTNIFYVIHFGNNGLLYVKEVKFVPGNPPSLQVIRNENTRVGNNFKYFPDACIDRSGLVHIVAENLGNDVDYFVYDPGTPAGGNPFIKKITLDRPLTEEHRPSIACISDTKSESPNTIDLVVIAFDRPTGIINKTWHVFLKIFAKGGSFGTSYKELSGSQGSSFHLITNAGRPKIRVYEAGNDNGRVINCLPVCNIRDTRNKYLLALTVAATDYGTNSTIFKHVLIDYKNFDYPCKNATKYSLSFNTTRGNKIVEDIEGGYNNIGYFITHDGSKIYLYKVQFKLKSDYLGRCTSFDNLFAFNNTDSVSTSPSDINMKPYALSSGPSLTDLLFVRTDATGSKSLYHKYYVPPNKPPVVTFSARPTTGNAPLTVTFNYTVTDPNGDPVNCTIYYGDGSLATDLGCNGSPRTHIYRRAGTYTAKIVARDSKGAATTRTVTITVNNPPPPNKPPVVTFSARPTTGNAPLTVTFNYTVTDPNGDPVTCWLDLNGNGTYERRDIGCNGSPRTYTYSRAGTYTAKIKATDGKGGVTIKTVTITVNNPPPPNTPPSITSFGLKPSEGKVPLVVTFSWDIVDFDGDTLKCILDFGDGNYSIIDNCRSGMSKVHVYKDPGFYTVELTVYDSKGSKDSSTLTVTVYPSSNQPSTAGAGGCSMSQQPTSLGNILSWLISVIGPFVVILIRRLRNLG